MRLFSRRPAQREELLVPERAPVGRKAANATYRHCALEHERRRVPPIEDLRRQLVHQPRHAFDDDVARVAMRFPKVDRRRDLVGHQHARAAHGGPTQTFA